MAGAGRAPSPARTSSGSARMVAVPEGRIEGPMLKLSEMMRTGTVAGFQVGSTYEHMVAVLGSRPPEAVKLAHPWYRYGDLEIFFGERDGQLVTSLIYLNQSDTQIRVDAAIPFDDEGLHWGSLPGEFCRWMIKHGVPFSYDPQRNSIGEPQNPEDYIDILLPGSRACVLSPGLSEIYISISSHHPPRP
jgi:hypothetical protein